MDQQEKLNEEENRKASEMKEDTAVDIDAQIDQIMSSEPEKGKKKKRDKKKRFWSSWSKKGKIITAAAGVLVVWVVGSGLFGGSETAFPVSVMSLEKGQIAETLTVNGPISGTDSVDVVSNLHTEVLDILVKEGDQVKKDQLLAVLDSTQLQKEMEIAQNGYAKAGSDYEAAKLNYERLQVLAQTGAVSDLELETAKNAMENAGYQLKNQEFELEQKKDDLVDTQVISPIDGTVVRVHSKVGRFADKTEEDKPMFVIENLENLEMEIQVSEYSIGKVAVGQPVVISADILNGETVFGEISAISPTGEEKGGGSTERVVPATIRIIDKNSRLIAGITAKAEITLAEAVDTFVVPVSALMQQDDGTQAIVTVENNSLHMIPVETGVESDIQIEVFPAEGFQLTEGMQVVTIASPQLTEGMQVMITAGQEE